MPGLVMRDFPSQNFHWTGLTRPSAVGLHAVSGTDPILGNRPGDLRPRLAPRSVTPEKTTPRPHVPFKKLSRSEKEPPPRGGQGAPAACRALSLEIVE